MVAADKQVDKQAVQATAATDDPTEGAMAADMAADTPVSDFPPRTSTAPTPGESPSDSEGSRPSLIRMAAMKVVMRARQNAMRRQSQESQESQDTRDSLPREPRPVEEGMSDLCPLVVCSTCAGLGWYRRDVPLGHPDFGVPIRCGCKRDEDSARAAARAARASNLTDEMRTLAFSGYLPSRETRVSWQAMRAFAADPAGWIVLAGGVGTGKTHLLAACANELLASGQEGRHPLYVVVPDFLDYLRAVFVDHAFDWESDEETGERADMSERMHAAIHADVLLLDDLGAEKRTPWTDERLYMVLNARYNAAAPTVIATNVTPESGSIEGRIASRMSDVALSQVLVMVSEDFRLRSDHRPYRAPRAGKSRVRA